MNIFFCLLIPPGVCSSLKRVLDCIIFNGHIYLIITLSSIIVVPYCLTALLPDDTSGMRPDRPGLSASKHVMCRCFNPASSFLSSLSVPYHHIHCQLPARSIPPEPSTVASQHNYQFHTLYYYYYYYFVSLFTTMLARTVGKSALIRGLFILPSPDVTL